MTEITENIKDFVYKNDIVKQKADEITLSNDEDGVAVFLEKLLKEMEEN